jgi:hypothetical protein
VRRRLGAGVVAVLVMGLAAATPVYSQTLTSPTVATFTAVVLNGTPQTTTAAVASFTVADLTLSGAGWHVTVAATQLCEQAAPATCASPNPKKLPIGSLDHSAPTVSGTPPLPSVFAPTGIDGSSAKLASAAAGTGGGTFIFGTSTLTLRIPANAYAKTYFSAVTYTVASGP